MDTKQAILTNLQQSDAVVDAYLQDLAPQELLVRPVPGANHLAWQLGHLIASERYLVDKAVPGKMPALPDGFAERHKKETSTLDGAESFLSKEEYLRLRKDVRASTLRVIEGLSSEDLDRPVQGVPPFVKTIGEVLLLVGGHWLMHAGQWAVIRRKLGRPPLF
jgi:hypothetical protein